MKNRLFRNSKKTPLSFRLAVALPWIALLCLGCSPKKQLKVVIQMIDAQEKYFVNEAIPPFADPRVNNLVRYIEQDGDIRMHAPSTVAPASCRPKPPGWRHYRVEPIAKRYTS